MFPFYLFSFILGTAIGSFLNVCVYRTKNGFSFLKGRSHCPNCKQKIVWYDNIPLVGFFVLRGKCRQCVKKISWSYPIVELCTGLLFFIILLLNNIQYSIFSIGYITYQLSVASLLFFIFIYDLKFQEMTDGSTIYPAILLFFLLSILKINTWQSMVIGILITAGFFLLQYFISKGKWIGGGDIKLGVLMGVILGWKLSIIALIIAYVGGAIISIFLLILKKKTWQSAVPFGIFLVPAAFISMYFGKAIWSWYYFKIFGLY